MGTPVTGDLQTQIDRAVRSSPQEGVLGGAFRDHNSSWILGFKEKKPLTSPAMAEIQALKRGLMLGMERNLASLEINTNSTDIVSTISHGHLLYDNLIFECRYLMQALNALIVVHTYIEQNRVADISTKEGLKLTNFGAPTLLEVPPVHPHQALQAAIVRTTFARTIIVGNNLSQGLCVAQTMNMDSTRPLPTREDILTIN